MDFLPLNSPNRPHHHALLLPLSLGRGSVEAEVHDDEHYWAIWFEILIPNIMDSIVSTEINVCCIPRTASYSRYACMSTVDVVLLVYIVLDFSVYYEITIPTQI